jgi:hypothetical protein
VTSEHPIAEQAFTMHGRLGTFWVESFSGDMEVLLRSMSSLQARSSAPFTLLGGMRAAAGAPAVQWAGRRWSFKAGDVVAIGPFLQQRILTKWAASGYSTGYVTRRVRAADVEYLQSGHFTLENEFDASGVKLFQTEGSQYWLFPSPTGVPVISPTQDEVVLKYALPIPQGQYPTSLRNIAGRDFALGVDYRQSGNLLIFGCEHPDSLFPQRVIIAPAGWEKTSGLLNYTNKLDGVMPSTFPGEYYRQNQSAESWLRALAVASGMHVMESAAVIADVETLGRDTFYTTTAGDVHAVDYPHRRHTVGDNLIRGDILGSPLRIYHKRHAGDDSWWKQLDWSAGLSMDSFCLVKGLTAPDASVGASWVSTEDGKYHIRFPLTGTSDAQDAYWNMVWENERVTGKYLNDIVGIASTSQIVPVNPVHLLFSYGLNESAWVLDRYNFQLWDGKSQRDFSHFFKSERPFGSVMITRESTI